MLETTKEQRAHFLGALKLMTEDQIGSPPVTSFFLHALCRDVNELEEALGEITLEFAALIVATDMTLGVPDKPSEGHDHAHDVLARAQAVLAPKDREEVADGE